MRHRHSLGCSPAHAIPPPPPTSIFTVTKGIHSKNTIYNSFTQLLNFTNTNQFTNHHALLYDFFLNTFPLAALITIPRSRALLNDQTELPSPRAPISGHHKHHQDSAATSTPFSLLPRLPSYCPPRDSMSLKGARNGSQVAE